MNFCKLRRALSLITIVTIISAPAVYSEEIDYQVEYPELKQQILQRYEPIKEQLSKAEDAFGDYFDKVVSEELDLGATLPGDYAPWWRNGVTKKITSTSSTADEDIDSLFKRALFHSSQIKVFSDLPLIRETTIQEAKGPYDFRVFLEGKYADIDEPVGDELRTGGPDRYKEDSRSLTGGLKRRFSTGGEVKLEQEIGDIDTNSIYFNPDDQAIAVTRLTVTHPLLRGAGIEYNKSTIELARLDHNISEDEFRRQVESHLLEIVRAYWGLYLERSILLQKRKLVKDSEQIYNNMKERIDIDVLPSLLARAKSLFIARQMDAVQAEFAMKNAEDKIRALINDPSLINAGGLEMLPKQMPQHRLEKLSIENLLTVAFENRPEIDQTVKQLKAAAIRLRMAEKDLWPFLDLYFETYVTGLEGDYQYGDAYDEQFDEGNPSYRVGLRFEYPLGNNSSEARERRKRIELRQLLHQLDTTVENIILEVQVSFRELIKNHKEMERKYQVMEATSEEIDALEARIDHLLTENEAFGDFLYRLLDAKERLNESEFEFAKSELTYNLSIFNLNRAIGTLVSVSDIKTVRDEEDELPVIRMEIK